MISCVGVRGGWCRWIARHAVAPPRLLQFLTGTFITGIALLTLTDPLQPSGPSQDRHRALERLKVRIGEHANLTREPSCSSDDGTVKLGSHMAWGSENNPDGKPTVCVFCPCSVKQVGATPEFDCIIRDCPYYTCSLGPDYNPGHPCCSICSPAAVTEATTAAAPDTSAASISSEVPLTSDIYKSEFRHQPIGLCRSEAVLAIVCVTSQPQNGQVRSMFRELYKKHMEAAGMKMVFLLGKEEIIKTPFNNFQNEEDTYYVIYDGKHDDTAEHEHQPGFMSDVRNTESDGEEKNDVLDDDEGGVNVSAFRELSESRQKAVDEEASRFNDIIQSNVAEHYNHLALKTVSLLDALRGNCSHVRFVVKTDDDVFINVRKLWKDLANLTASNTIYGQIPNNRKPDRSGLGWFSSLREWPYKEFPPFCLGPGYLIPGDALQQLFSTALRTRFHHLEDVFVTGIVAEAAGVERRQWNGLCSSGGLRLHVCEVARCALLHRISYDVDREELELQVFALGIPGIEELCK